MYLRCILCIWEEDIRRVERESFDRAILVYSIHNTIGLGSVFNSYLALAKPTQSKLFRAQSLVWMTRSAVSSRHHSNWGLDRVVFTQYPSLPRQRVSSTQGTKNRPIKKTSFPHWAKVESLSNIIIKPSTNLMIKNSPIRYQPSGVTPLTL